ncbi:3-phosphoshikimate 1-carboxyvinyltransferase [Candidatus Izemoplasma sp. B36]|uniref:3-phosphoshikimate 1-carboxyvinyltransferase n=1 Tax=Candidatus Izemoplasma sp. B36 TaxID=3242468 RepID=UPI003558B24E
MIVEVYPSKVKGTIEPPASKSYLHRAIISASIAKGTSIIHNVIYSDDVNATLDIFASLGVAVERYVDRLVITSKGIDSFTISTPINCNESGSTLRFVIPILSNQQEVYFKGKSSLMSRPMHIYEEIFSYQGLTYKKQNDSIVTRGKIKPGKFKIPGNISSQFISGLLFVLPLLNGDSEIEILGTLESSSYINMTIDVLESFGIFIKHKKNRFLVNGNQSYKPTEIFAENDFSQMAFFSVLGIINNDITIKGMNFNSFQPDKVIIDAIINIGGIVEKHSDIAIFKRSKTSDFTFDLSQSPDLAPILSVLASKSHGFSRLINGERLKIKESNRLLTTYNSLKQMGVRIIMGDDYLEIVGPNKFRGGEFDSYNDHRIAMMLAIAATVAESKTTITNAEAINKSYPNFYTDLESLGVKIKYIEE